MNFLDGLNNDLPGIKKEWPKLSEFWKETLVGTTALQVDACDRLMKLTPESVLSIFAKSELDSEHELVQKVMFRLKLWRSIS
jgi:hypothetical protein